VTGPVTGPGTAADQAARSSFEAHRDRIFGLAYRMTGSVSDAEDVVQETWIRWQRSPTDSIASPEAWLVRVATNVSLDRLRSAQRRREQYVGSWLPEPLVDHDGPGHVDPGEEAVTAESLTLAFLVVLDELRPEDRAVFLLHEVFAYPYDEIASMVGRTPAACRQAVSRARQRIEASGAVHRRPRGADEDALLARVVEAMTVGDIDAVMRYMAPDVVVVSDAGSERRAARRPVVGPARSARLLVNLSKRVPEGAEITLQRFNGDPTIVLREEGEMHTTLTFEFAEDGRLRRVYAMRNPEKLRHVGT